MCVLKLRSLSVRTESARRTTHTAYYRLLLYDQIQQPHRINRWMNNGWMDGWVGGWMDFQSHAQIGFSLSTRLVKVEDQRAVNDHCCCTGALD